MLSRAAGPLSAILRRLIVVARAINICTYRESGSDQDRGATLFIRDTKKTLGCRSTSFTLIFCFALASKYGVLNCSARASASATDTCTIIKTGDAGWPSFARAVMGLYTSDKTPTCPDLSARFGQVAFAAAEDDINIATCVLQHSRGSTRGEETRNEDVGASIQRYSFVRARGSTAVRSDAWSFERNAEWLRRSP